MSKELEYLLAMDGTDGEVGDETHEEIENALYELDSEEIAYEFEEGSRWHNYQRVIHRVTTLHDGEFHFAIRREVPATEMQDGGDFSYDFDRVFPQEKTVIVYE